MGTNAITDSRYGADTVQIVTGQELALTQFVDAVRYWNHGVRSGQLTMMATQRQLPLIRTALAWKYRARAGQLSSAAIVESRCVGMAHVKGAYGRRRCSGVIAVTVDADYQHNAIGPRLVSHLAAQAWTAGYARLTAEPVERNRGAIRMLMNLGFEEEARCPASFRLDDDSLAAKVLLRLMAPASKHEEDQRPQPGSEHR